MGRLRGTARDARLGIIVVSALLAVGCGSAEKVRSGLSNATYRARADAICAGADARLVALGVPRRPEQFGPFARKAAPILQSALRRLRGLEAPEQLADRVQAFQARLGATADLLRRAATAAEAGNAGEAQRLAGEAGTQAQAASSAAKAVGYHVCGRLPRF